MSATYSLIYNFSLLFCVRYVRFIAVFTLGVIYQAQGQALQISSVRLIWIDLLLSFGLLLKFLLLVFSSSIMPGINKLAMMEIWNVPLPTSLVACCHQY